MGKSLEPGASVGGWTIQAAADNSELDGLAGLSGNPWRAVSARGRVGRLVVVEWSDAASRQHALTVATVLRAAPWPRVRAVLDAGELEPGGLFYVLAEPEPWPVVEGSPARPAWFVHGAVADVAAGLAWLRAQRLDARPWAGGIRVSAEGRASLSDLEVVRPEGVPLPGEDNPELDFQDRYLGRPDYLAPELIDDDRRPYAPTMDVYTLACLALELLLGRAPFSRRTFVVQLYEHLHVAPPSLGVAELDRVLARALAKRPEERQPSVAQFLAELYTVIYPPPPPPPPEPERAPTPLTFQHLTYAGNPHSEWYSNRRVSGTFVDDRLTIVEESRAGKEVTKRSFELTGAAALSWREVVLATTVIGSIRTGGGTIVTVTDEAGRTKSGEAVNDAAWIALVKSL